MGKTSLLVQFDQGKFIPGSFSATVGIGFTVSAWNEMKLDWLLFIHVFKFASGISDISSVGGGNLNVIV